jgi:hypothetical protein
VDGAEHCSCLRYGRGRGATRDAKVCHLHLTIGSQQDILGFDVPVDQATPMRRGEGRAYVDADAQRLADWQLPGRGDRVLEGLAGDKLHDDVVLGAILANIIDSHNIWMGQARGQPRFLIETAQEFCIVRELRQKCFHRHAPTEAQILCLVDPGHAAFAKDTYQPVPAAEHLFIHGNKGST